MLNFGRVSCVLVVTSTILFQGCSLTPWTCLPPAIVTFTGKVFDGSESYQTSVVVTGGASMDFPVIEGAKVRLIELGHNGEVLQTFTGWEVLTNRDGTYELSGGLPSVERSLFLEASKEGFQRKTRRVNFPNCCAGHKDDGFILAAGK